MNFLDDGRNNRKYEWINPPLRDGNVMNMSLIIIELNYSTIDDDDSTCHGYYIIVFSSSRYTLKSHLNIYGQVISSGEMVCEETYNFAININSCYYVSPKINPITKLYLWRQYSMS